MSLGAYCAHSQWQIASTPSSFVTFREVEYVTQDTVFVISDNELFTSVDGGGNWSTVYNFGPFINVTELAFHSNLIGFLRVGSDLHRTFDGGLNWELVEPIFQVVNYQLLNGNLYKNQNQNDSTYISQSSDFGDNWNLIQIVYAPQATSSFFLSENEAYFLNKHENYRLFHTTDGFVTIDTINVFNGVEPDMNFTFKDSDHGYFYGSNQNDSYTWFGDSTVIFQDIKLDGLDIMPSLGLDHSTSKLYASSAYGNIFVSDQNGQIGTWVQMSVPQLVDEMIFWDIEFFDENHGIAVGSSEIVFINNASTLSTLENDELDLEIFPNPTSNILFIDGLKTPNDYIIVSNDGKTVLEGETLSQIDISLLRKGAYSLVLGEGQKRIPFIKN